eukprot:SAG31_NODE_14194_length_822_cov_0.922545_1_plen_161_part_01
MAMAGGPTGAFVVLLVVLVVGACVGKLLQQLADKVSAVASNSIVILKNIDAFVSNRAMAGVSKDLSFSGLLNVIDGALGHNKGLLMILTTNRYARLCEDQKSADALLRPGRVSLTAYLGPPTPHQLVVYFQRMFGSNAPNTRSATADLSLEEPQLRSDVDR